MSRNGLHILGADNVSAGEAGSVAATRAAPVLLVEDDAAIAGALGEALREEGVDVATAQNGREALQVLRGGLRPSAILLDLMMPVMDGWDFRQEQLRDPDLREIPVIVVTATGFSTDTIRTQFGNVDLLPKPVPFEDLLVLLGRGRSAGSVGSSAA
jgi:CheY-like chemotaxis protein